MKTKSERSALLFICCALVVSVWPWRSPLGSLVSRGEEQGTNTAWFAAPEDALGVLDELGIPYDRQKLQCLAVETMLRAVDPGVRISITESTHTPKEQDNLHAEEWPENLCYLRVGHFGEGTGSNLVAQIEKWLDDGRRGIILDIRSCSGWDLDSVDIISGLFVPEGTDIFSVVDFHGSTVATHKACSSIASATNLMAGVIAIDSDTRGAAEMLAAILKGKPRVVTVGWRTRGDFAPRKWVQIGHGTSARLPVARIICEGIDASSWPASGIDPDFAVSTVRGDRIPTHPLPGRTFSDKAERSIKLMRRVSDDPVLGACVDILLALQALGYNGGCPTDLSRKRQGKADF